MMEIHVIEGLVCDASGYPGWSSGNYLPCQMGESYTDGTECKHESEVTVTESVFGRSPVTQ